MQFHPTRFGVAFGLIWGLGMLLMGWGAWLTGWATPLVLVFGSGYVGFTPTFWGGLVGFFWGFIDFFVFGFLLAWVYNRLCASGQ